MIFSSKKKYILLILIAVLVVSFTFRQHILLFGLNILKPLNEDLSNELIATFDSKDISVENEKLKSIIEDDNFLIYMPVVISEGYSTGGSRLNEKIALDAFEKYRVFANSNNTNKIFPDYSKNVSLILWFSGKSHDAIHVIESIELANLPEEKRDEINIIKSGFYLSLLEFGKVSENLEKVTGKKYDNLKNLISTSAKNFTEPDKSYLIEEPLVSDKTDLDRYFEELFQYSEYEKYEIKNTGNKISGYISDNSNPVAGVIIYATIRPGVSSSRDFEKYTVTDENGYYEIDGLDYEKISLRLQIPWNKIADKQIESNYEDRTIVYEKGSKSESKNFEFFDAVKIKSIKVENGNLIYDIHDPRGNPDRIYYFKAKPANSKDPNSQYSDIKISYENLKGSIPIDKLRSSFDISYSSHGYEDDLVLENFLEPLYIEGNYMFDIAISLKNNISSYITNGFFPNNLSKKVYVESPYTLSQGDKFLEAKEFKKAIEWFESNESEHGYKVLSALYSRGYIITPESEFSFDRDGKDLEKALFYKKKLYELNTENDGNLLQVIWAYNDLKMYDEEYKMILNYKELNNSTYSNFLLAKNRINSGKLMEGIKIYLDYANPTLDYDRYFGYLFLANETSYLPNSYLEHFKEFDLTDFEEFFQIMKKGQYQKAHKWLLEADSSDKIDKNLLQFYTLIYLDEFKKDDFNDFIEYYIEKTNEIENYDLKWILEELKYTSNWF